VVRIVADRVLVMYLGRIAEITRTVLVDYLQRRQQFLGPRRSDFVFVSNRGTRLDGGRVRRTFYTLSRETGLRALGSRNGPRLHDYRHNSEHPIIPSGFTATV
jgi:site-specific recombinase XerD